MSLQDTLKKLFVCCMCLTLSSAAKSQMISGVDTLYGNEWINFNASDRYFKISIANDGIYRLKKEDLPASASNVLGDQFQIWRNGEEIPLYVSTGGIFSNDDFIEFFGARNRIEVDKYLFSDQADIFNPEHSMITDTSAYFLTWTDNSGINNRFQNGSNSIAGAPPAEQFFMYQDLKYFGTYHNKFTNISSLQQSYFDTGQGYGQRSISGSRQNLIFKTEAVSDQFNEGEFNYWYATYSNAEHQQRVRLDNKIILIDTFFGIQFKKTSIPLIASQFKDEMNFEIRGMVSNGQDRQVVSIASLTYPREFSFGDTTVFKFSLPASSDSKYYEITDFDVSSSPILYDLTNNVRIEALVENNTIKIILPPSSVERDLILVNSTTGVNEISDLVQTDFFDFSDYDVEFVILTSKKLSGGGTAVQEYETYRAKKFKTAIVEVENLYQQFSYGINRHPLGIKNFINFLNKNGAPLEYVLILGKGREYVDIREENELAGSGLLVPTYGFPGSDNILFSKHFSSTPLVKIGRVTAKTQDDVRNYLDKLKLAESFPDRAQTIIDKQWAKKIIHLGGGKDTDQALIRNILDRMDKKISVSELGAKVFSFYKTSIDPIQNSRSKEIQNLINGGVSIVNFFGHSSASSFDFNIEDPQEYDNKGKYFLLISNGCFSGRCHTSSSSIGELFILEKDRGAISYYASTGLGGITAMDEFTTDFYNRLGDTEYGNTMGDIFVSLIGSMDVGLRGFTLENLLSQQQTLQGDPAVRLYPAEGPDFVFDVENTFHSPDLLSTRLDSFELTTSIANLGSATTGEMVVSLEQKNVKGETIHKQSLKIEAPSFEKSLTFAIPITAGEDAIGENTFLLTLDSTSLIEELPQPQAEQNNIYSNGRQVGYEVLISSNDLTPVYPPEYGIVTKQGVELKASTSNAILEPQEFIFELDTSQNFTSPIKLSQIITQPGGVMKWKPNITLEDNIVYYWRTGQANSQTGDTRWSNSSFVFSADGEPGWNQSHYYQFLNNEFDKTMINPDRRLEFVNDFKDLILTNGVAFFNPNDRSIWYNPCLTINNIGLDCSISNREGDNGIRIYVIDSLTLEPRKVPDGFAPPSVVGRQFFSFETDNYDGRKAAISFLQDSIPKGNYVAVITYTRFQTSSFRSDLWAGDIDSLGINLFDVLESKGAQMVRSLDTLGSKPYGIMYKEGFPGLIADSEFIVMDSLGKSDKSLALFTKWEEGSIFSPPVGPTKGWNQLSWEADKSIGDRLYANVFGIEKDGQKRLIETQISEGDFDLSNINSEEYPFLQLEFFSSDSTSRTPAHLKYWRVTHDEVPEMAVNPQVNFAISGDTVRLGEDFEFSIGLENISETDMDSLLVQFKLTDDRNNITFTEQRIEPLPAGQTAIVATSIPTQNFNGLQSLILDANPKNDQIELTHINNTAVVNFYVEGDHRNPLMDVTFDGVRIMNGDLVSSEPFIEVKFRDENEFLLLNDTSLFKVFLKKPNEDDFQELNIELTPEITFVPADAASPQNEARIEYRPQFDVDGIYQLKVQGTDVSGNPSGKSDFLISFKVINESMISNVLNYPNPFNNRTRFVYTLTGNEAPAFFKLQILTVSGRVARELTQADLGNLKIGTHQTENFWDGTDEFGDPLANGVYLYRMTAQKSDNSEYERYEEEDIDGFFKRGFGKLVILR